MSNQRLSIKAVLLVAVIGCLIVAFLGVVNTYWPGSRAAVGGRIATSPQAELQSELRVMAFNMRWCGRQQDCLDRVASLIREQQADVVMLAAVYYECAICETGNQVQYLAQASGMPEYAFGENFRIGLPYLQLRSGNAILSKLRLTEVATQSLSREFIRPRAARQALWATVRVGETDVLLGALHNSASDAELNLRQARLIAERIGSRAAVLGGDLNAAPDSQSIERLLSAGLVGDTADTPTYFEGQNRRRTDYILGPANWRLTGHEILDSDLSAHRPIVSSFEIR